MSPNIPPLNNEIESTQNKINQLNKEIVSITAMQSLESYDLSKKKLTSIDIETSIIHIANSFLSQGMSINSYEDTFVKNDDSQDTIVLKKILADIAKKSKIFHKKIKQNVDLAVAIFEKLEKTIKKETSNPTASRGSYDKKCRLNKDGDLEANAILLCMMLIREHRHLKSRKTYLQYKLADEVIESLKDNKTKGYENARILAKRYVEKLNKL